MLSSCGSDGSIEEYLATADEEDAAAKLQKEMVLREMKERFYQKEKEWKKSMEEKLLDIERMHQQKLLGIQRDHQEELDNKLTAARLVHSAQLQALIKYLTANSQLILNEKLIQKEEHFQDLLNSRWSSLLERVCNLEGKLQELTHSLVSKEPSSAATDESYAKCGKEMDEFLTLEPKLVDNELLQNYQQRIVELENLHREVITEMEQKFAAEQIEREAKIETAVREELSRANEIIEKRLNELEESQIERERRLIIKHNQQMDQLNLELHKRGESEKHWQDRFECLKLEMEEVKKEKEVAIDACSKEKEKLISVHYKELNEVKENLLIQIENVTHVAEQRKIEDNAKLELLQLQLHKMKEEKNTLHTSLITLYHSVASLLPAAPTCNEDTPIISHPNEPLPLATPATDWASPFPVQRPPSHMVTPNSPTYKLTKVVDTGDSGLASNQTSGSKAPPSNYNGSVLRSLRGPSETMPIMTTPTPNLSISYIHDEEDVPTELGQLVPTDNITICSLNSTLTEDYNYDQITEEMVSQLYQCISMLINSYINSPQELSNVQGELIKSQTSLNNQLKHVEQLQSELNELRNELASNKDKDEELFKTQEKIATLISEIEVLQKSHEENNELVSEAEQLLKDYRQLETSHNELQVQCNEYQQTIEMLKNEKATVQSNFTKQMELAEKKSQSEYSALEKLYRETRMKLETEQEQHRHEVDFLKQEYNTVLVQLQKSTNQIHELEQLPAQLLIKEKKEEELQESIKDLSSQLTAALHRAAMNESAPDLQKQLDVLQQQLKQYKEKHDGILKIYEEGVASLTRANETIEKSKEIEEALQARVCQHNKDMELKNEEVQKLLELKETMEADCKKLNEQISTLSNSVDTLTEQLKKSNEQVSELCHQLEQKDSSIDELMQQQLNLEGDVQKLQRESEMHLKAYQQSVLEVQKLQDELEKLQKCLHEKEKEIDFLTTSKGELSDKLAHLQTEVVNKQEYHKLEVLSLRKNLEQMKSELSLKESNEDEIKKVHEQELRELEDKLQAEYAGQEALLRIQLQELSDTHLRNNEQLLQQIAKITPLMEQDAQEVLHLCQDHTESLGAYIVKLQEKSSETIKSLKDENAKLEKEVVVTRETLTELENSMKLANETLLTLKTELKMSTERERNLQEKLDETNLELSQIKECYEKLLSDEKEKTLKESRSLQNEKDSLVNECDKLKRQLETERELHNKLQIVHRELVLAHEEAKQSNIALEENMKRVQNLLSDLTRSKEKNDQLTELLENERQQIDSLQRQVENKEVELSKTMEQYLAEKLTVAKLRGDNVNLVSQLNNLKENQISEKEKVQASKLPLLEAKCKQLRMTLHQTQNKCKALIFQKRYMQSEINAYYHTHQAALLMIQDMGGLPWQPSSHRTPIGGRKKFKATVQCVIAIIRMRKLCYKKQCHKTF